MMKLKFFLILFVLSSLVHHAQAESRESKTYWDDGIKAISLMGNGSIEQFKTKSNLYALPLVATTLWYSFEEDKRISNLERSKKIKKPIQLAGDFAVIANFPIIPLTTYYLGQKNQNEKLVQFSIEYFSTLYLALLESAALSLVPIHERPKKEDLSPWETNFRGKSSFPSGHVIPYAVLMFKSFQYYGGYAAILPGVLTVMASKQRVQDGKHYLSDVVGGVWLAFFASEGVRKANGFKDNSETYKKYFESDFETGILYYNGEIGRAHV